MTWDMWNLVRSDRCTVCAKRTIDSEIVLDTPMELLGDVGLVDSRFVPFRDAVSVDVG